jgi:hypothetical protein
MVENRHDSEAMDLQQHTDNAQVLSALETVVTGADPRTSTTPIPKARGTGRPLRVTRIKAVGFDRRPIMDDLETWRGLIQVFKVRITRVHIDQTLLKSNAESLATRCASH